MAKDQLQSNRGALKKTTLTEATRWLRKVLIRILEKAESGPVRAAAAGIGVVVVLWLLFSRVYIPLNQEAGLPPGVTDRNPQLKENEIEFLVDQYTERLRHTPKSYAEYRGLFTTAP